MELGRNPQVLLTNLESNITFACSLMAIKVEDTVEGLRPKPWKLLVTSPGILGTSIAPP